MECLDDYLVALYRKVDIMEMPKPEAATKNISTVSRFLLKYWATIRVDVSRVSPTPRPTGQTIIIKPRAIVEQQQQPRNLSFFTYLPLRWYSNRHKNPNMI